MTDIASLNKKLFNEDEVVAYYSRLYQLQGAEKTVLDAIRDNLADMKMLDVGVGGGRTSVHFANSVKEYIGVDYSSKMIESCKTRFPGNNSNISFRVCDVRAMPEFKDGYFDFILYSHNGIDCMSHEDRLKALGEIKRVCRKGGLFCFSTHNLNTFLHIPVSRNLYRTTRRACKFLSMRRTIRDNSYAIISDYDVEFQSRYYYIKPQEQVKQLNEAGFKDVHIFSLDDGREIREDLELGGIRDTWLYYLATSV